MKKIATAIAATAAAIAVATATPANAAQGGFNRNGDPHAWIKIGRAEMAQAGNDPQQNCWAVLRSTEGNQNRFTACANLVPGVKAEQLERPNAQGYWAEWYYNSGKSRSGTW